jgi:hypothetical protein
VLDAGLLLEPGLLQLELGGGRHGLLLLELGDDQPPAQREKVLDAGLLLAPGLLQLELGVLLLELGDGQPGSSAVGAGSWRHPGPEFLEKPLLEKPEFLEKPVTVFLQVRGLCLRCSVAAATHKAAAGRWLQSGN